jgi:hypothetical protein
MRRLSVLAFASVLAAVPAVAAEGYPSPKPGQSRQAYGDMAADAYDRIGRVEAMQALSDTMGAVQVNVINSLRFRALLRDNARVGVDEAQARAYLMSNGASREKVDVAVRALMRADADGNGRVTRAEFEASQGALVGGAMAAIRGVVSEDGPLRQAWESRGMSRFDGMDADRDGTLSDAEARQPRR